MDFGIPRNKVRIFMVNVDWEFLGIPNCNNSGSKNLEIPRNSKLITNRTWNSLEFQLRAPMTFPERLWI